MALKKPYEMDRVWRDFEPTDESLSHLDGPSCGESSKSCFSITSESLLSTKNPNHYREIRGEQDWASWKTDCVPAVTSTSKPSFSLLMCPRKEISEADPKEFARVQHYRMALSWIPIQKAKFKDVLTRMHVPSVFMDMVKRPRTVFKKLKSSVQGQPCEVYILSVDSILTQYTAMSITYFPKTQQVFGLFLGYGSPDDVTNMASKLFNNRAFVNNPFVLVSAFLELERKHRLRQVDNMVDGLRIKISKGQHIQKSNKETSDDQPETFYELYNQVGVLRSQLNMWKLQLDKLLTACPTLPPFNTLSTEGFMLEPTDYVTEIREIFEESAMRCENVMQATSLAFQKELAEVARQDSKVAIGDAQQMKAIALLTMFFLPATAVAGFMDAPVYDWENKGHYFWYIAGPLTGAVMLMYLVWTTVLKTRRTVG